MEDMLAKRTHSSRVKNSHDSKKTLLITGFEPFGDDPSALNLNPSAAIAQALHGQCINTWQIEGHVLPCVFEQSVRVLTRLIKTHSPAAILCIGQAGGRSAISIERLAVNWDEASLADNAGVVRSGQTIGRHAPAAYFSTLPIHTMRDNLLAQGIPTELSSTAGHFVCNHVFFSLMHALRGKKIPAGFVHVPYLPEQAAKASGLPPAMPLYLMQKGIRLAIASLPI